MTLKRLLSTPWFWPWVLLVLLSIAAHLWLLDQRPFHSDEAVHAKLAYDFLHQGDYQYDPTYHGPLLYFIVSLFYLVLGDSDFTARLPSAVLGVLMLALIFRLRRPFGMRTAWFVGLLFTISPLCLYYSRFLRMDMLELFTASACFLSAYRAALHGERRYWLWSAFWAGLAVATKENAYVTMVLAVATAVLTASACDRFPRPGDVTRLAARHARPLIAAGSIFVLVTVTLYTVALRQPQDWLFAIEAVRFWTGQHHIERIGGPWWYHLFRLGVYEFLVMGAAAVWILRRAKLRRIELALLIFGLGSLVMYANLGEKVPWLGVHQLWAFFPLAGAQLARTFGPMGSWWGRAVAGAALAATVAVSFNANFVHPFRSPTGARMEALHFSETAPELLELAARITARGGDRDRPVASVSGHAVWPLAWYWRDQPVQWRVLKEADRPRLVVVNSSFRDELEAELGDDYEYREVQVRYWWHPERRAPTAAEFLRYLVWREPWMPPVVASSIVATRKQ